KEQLDRLWQTQQTQRYHRLNRMEDLLKALDPQSVLKKGYSILFTEKESLVINSIKKLQNGQKARLLLSDGEVIITINEVTPRDHKSHTRTHSGIHSFEL